MNLQNFTKPIKDFLSKYKVPLQIILIPLIISIIPFALQSSEANGAFVIILLSVYWIFECIPMAITSVLPVCLFPMLGIIKSQDVAPFYFQDSVMFIFSSVIIGLGIESSGLHRKIALKACMLVGSKPKWLLLSIMCVTAFLSIWISNTATTSMILPIVMSVVRQLVKLDPKYGIKIKSDIEMTQIEKSETTAENSDLSDDVIFKSETAKKLMKGFCLAICFSATIGGSASLIGTSSNIVFKNHFDKYHPKDSLNFLTFMLFALPFAIFHLICAWLIICIMYLPKGDFIDKKYLFWKKNVVSYTLETKSNALENLIRRQYESLGPLTWEQISIGVWFCLVVILWMTRDLFFVPGWSHFFRDGYVTDSSSAILVVFIITSWPKQNIFSGKKYEALLSWKFIQTNFPWSIILLVGGSLAMAEGSEKSGLSVAFGNFLENIIPKNKLTALIIISIFSAIGTEFISNLSMASIILPILERLARINQIEYHYLLVPQALTVNFSFMFPAAAPTNAMVFASGFLQLKDMIISGLILKLFGLSLLFLASNTWLGWIFVEDLTILIASNSTKLLNSTFSL